MTIDSVLVHTLTEYLPSGINKPKKYVKHNIFSNEMCFSLFQ